MKSITLIFLTVILLGKLQASNTGSSATKNAAWTTLVGKDFTIQYPKDWILDQTGAMGTAFFLSAPKAKPDDEFVNTINLVIQNFDDPKMTLESYNDKTIAQLNKELPKANIISSKTVNAKL